MFFGERSVQDVLRQGVADILADRELLPMMLDGLPETVQQDALTWFRDHASDDLAIGNSFPRMAPEFPLIAVLPGGFTESDQFVGQVGAIERREDNSTRETDAIYFNSTTRALILSQNADATAFLAAFCIFTLARYRNTLTDLGLYEQTIQASDLNSAEEFAPELVFSRAVILSGKTEVAFPVALSGPPAGLQVGVNWNAQGSEALTVALPIHDDFDRPDAQVLGNAKSGQAWLALSGTWGIIGDQGYLAASAGSDRDSAVIDIGAADAQISVVFGHVVNGTRAIFRASDADNYLCIEATATGYAVRRRQAGVYVTLVTYGVARTDGDDINVLMSGLSVFTYLNGTRLGVVSEGFNRTATKCGIGAGTTAGAARFDSFDTA